MNFIQRLQNIFVIIWITMISNKGYICCNPMLTQKILKNVNETVLNRQVGNQYPIDSKIIIALNYVIFQCKLEITLNILAQ